MIQAANAQAREIPEPRLRAAIEKIGPLSGQLAALFREFTNIGEELDQYKETATSDQRLIIGRVSDQLVLASRNIYDAFGTDEAAGIYDLLGARPVQGTSWFQTSVVDGTYRAPDGLERKVYRYDSDRGPMYSSPDLNDGGISYWYASPAGVISDLIVCQIVDLDGDYELAPVVDQTRPEQN
jgi:hypothetical protein